MIERGRKGCALFWLPDKIPKHQTTYLTTNTDKIERKTKLSNREKKCLLLSITFKFEAIYETIFELVKPQLYL